MPHNSVAIEILPTVNTRSELEEYDEKMALYSMRLYPHGRHPA